MAKKMEKMRIKSVIADLRKRFLKFLDLLDSPKNKKRVKVFTILFTLIAVVYLGRSLVLAAWVGNKPIFRTTVIRLLEEQSGSVVLDSIVNEKLINYEAEKSGIKVTEEEIEAEIGNIRETLKASGLDLETALSMQNQTTDTLKKNLRMKISLEKMLGDKIVVGDDEVLEYYNENKTTYFDNANLEDVKDDIKNSLYEEKLSTEYQKWLEEAKNRVKIFYFKNYN